MYTICVGILLYYGIQFLLNYSTKLLDRFARDFLQNDLHNTANEHERDLLTVYLFQVIWL